MPPDSAAVFAADDLRRFAAALLEKTGLAADRAGDVAEVLLEADLLGHNTHGLALLAGYLRELQNGTMEKNGGPQVVADRGSALTWDGRLLPGPWLVRRAIAECRARIAQHPVVTVAIRRSHHIACLQAYLKPVTDDGLFILLTTSDPASRVVVPHGGVEARFSPNPLAAGIPTDAGPVLLDISLSATSYSNCLRTARDGGRLAGPWLVDGGGAPTDDPRELVKEKRGGLLPLGGVDLGYKGFGLAFIVEALTSALAGHGRADVSESWLGSVFLQIIDPEQFGGRAAFLRETGFLARSCRAAAVPGGRPPVRMPGDGALERRSDQLAHGVRLRGDIMPALAPWAARLGVEPPAAMPPGG